MLSLSRRQLLSQSLKAWSLALPVTLPTLLTMPANANVSSGQVASEKTLSDDLASLMRRSLLNFQGGVESQAGAAPVAWLDAMQQRVKCFLPNESAARRILQHVYYEASRAGHDVQLILALIEVESAFNQYAISPVGARGLMQIMPFWQRAIGEPWHNLFDVRTNLRYGCTILRHYRQVEKGNTYRALARYNGSLGKPTYPAAILRAWQRRWQYSP